MPGITCDKADKVLVVDDEKNIRKLVHRMLAKSSYSVVTAADGDEALNIVSQDDVGVVLLDIKMPGLSGMEVLRKLDVDYPDIFVVIMTAVAEIETAVEAMKLGACDYIIKPIKRSSLVPRVQKALELRNMRLESSQQLRLLESKIEEQAQQLQRYSINPICTAIREHNLVDALSVKQPLCPELGFSRLCPELRKASVSADEYRDVIFKMLEIA